MIRLILLVTLLAGACLGTTLSVDLLTPGPAVGTAFDVDIRLNTDNSVIAYQFNLAFTPGKLEIVSIAETGFFVIEGIGLAWDTIDNANGQVVFLNNIVSGDSPGVDGEDLLMRIQFLPLAAGPASIAIVDAFYLDAAWNFESPSTLDASFDILAAPVPEPGSFLLAGCGIVLLLLSVGRRKRPAGGYDGGSTIEASKIESHVRPACTNQLL